VYNTTLHYTTLHYTTSITQRHNYNCNCNYTFTTPHFNYNSTTLQLQLQVRYATLHPGVVGEVTTATTAATPKNTTPTTFGPSVDSACHQCITTTHFSYKFPIFETSATALRGTTGIHIYTCIYIYISYTVQLFMCIYF